MAASGTEHGLRLIGDDPVVTSKAQADAIIAEANDIRAVLGCR